MCGNIYKQLCASILIAFLSLGVYLTMNMMKDYVPLGSIEDVLMDSVKEISLEWVGGGDIGALRQQGLNIPHSIRRPCQFFVRRNVPLTYIHTLFEFWEREIRFSGITLPKSTRLKWKHVLYAEGTIQTSKGFQFLYNWRTSRESVQTVFTKTILVTNRDGTVSGILIVCQEEFSYDPLMVTITERHTALWGLLSWEESRREHIPRNIDTWSIKTLQEILRNDAVHHIYQIHQELSTEQRKQRLLM
ncbi:uncharacterized protein LOC134269768 isoform X3 [Saccostrea cucullata]|uniref:uncharacterized protein LOC134269768 isoform X3 n=2 Tax=Saccostrea cuccullata TaxID=36930 RepID=UPI002ED3FD80